MNVTLAMIVDYLRHGRGHTADVRPESVDRIQRAELVERLVLMPCRLQQSACGSRVLGGPLLEFSDGRVFRIIPGVDIPQIVVVAPGARIAPGQSFGSQLHIFGEQAVEGIISIVLGWE